MSQKIQRKTSKKKGKKSKKKKVDVVVEVDLTSDKAKNDMIQVRIKTDWQFNCQVDKYNSAQGSASQN